MRIPIDHVLGDKRGNNLVTGPIPGPGGQADQTAALGSRPSLPEAGPVDIKTDITTGITTEIRTAAARTVRPGPVAL